MQKSPDFSEQKYKEVVNRKYDSLFGNKKPTMTGYTNDTLKQTFVMYNTLSFYALENRYLTGMEAAFIELKRRGLEKTNYNISHNNSTFVGNMFSAYITQGDLSSAKRIQGEYPEILSSEHVPSTREPVEYLGKNWNLYSVSADGKYFELEPVDIKTRPMMLAIMSTDCHFSRRVLKTVLADPELKRDFEEYATIILPINESLSFIPEVVRWNSENPKLLFRVYSSRRDLRSGWEKFDFTSIPQFFFLKNGEVVDHIGGWGPNDEEFAIKLRKGLDKIKTLQ